ncbi:PREDICTED: cingulin-like isoform X2 [Branchiostoma belcheri]|uniref:Cingulin-like isoform X2 n=1 Tax=Branchiostoma belcheri TaxID=7741 RepID=A0A6P4XV61_BRABE|nr:PREDICTED: cingulin-like isoform X2 [Branchiostoma belcheri]
MATVQKPRPAKKRTQVEPAAEDSPPPAEQGAWEDEKEKTDTVSQGSLISVKAAENGNMADTVGGGDGKEEGRPTSPAGKSQSSRPGTPSNDLDGEKRGGKKRKKTNAVEPTDRPVSATPSSGDAAKDKDHKEAWDESSMTSSMADMAETKARTKKPASEVDPDLPGTTPAQNGETDIPGSVSDLKTTTEGRGTPTPKMTEIDMSDDEDTGQKNKRKAGKERQGSAASTKSATQETGQLKRPSTAPMSRPSTSDSAQMKRPKTAGSTRPSTAGTRRSPGEGTHGGSVPSMQSVISVEEAGADGRVDRTGGKRPQSAVSTDTRASTPLLSPPEVKGEQQAYVPYVYAKESIAKVMDDMKRMKGNHIKIVGQIEENYRTIENETQSQFNIFVLGLRSQYGDKVKTFRQVIEAHRAELQRKEQYWDESLTSLSQRNKQLLKEKRTLLIQNKVEFERLETEKKAAVAELTKSVDHEHKEFLQEKKLHEEDKASYLEELDFLRKSVKSMEEKHREQVTTMEEETKVLKDQYESEKTEVARLKELLAKSGDKGDIAIATAAAATVISTGVSIEERDRLQKQLVDVHKELAEMRAKYEATYAQLQTMVEASGKDSIEEKIEAVKKEKAVITEEEQRLRDEIEQWRKEFVDREGRDPTEEDRPSMVQENYVQLEEVGLLNKQLEEKLETLLLLRDGKMPQVKVEKVPEPITVTVPDPAVVAELDATRQKLAELQQLLQQKEKEKKDLEKEKKALEKENKKLSKNKSSGSPTASTGQLSQLQLLLQAVVEQVHSIHGDVKKAAEKVQKRCNDEEDQQEALSDTRDKAQQAVDDWAKKFEEENGREPTEEDRDEEAENLYVSLEESQKRVQENQTAILALTAIRTGQVPQEFAITGPTPAVTAATGVSSEELSELEDRIRELEEERDELKDTNSDLTDSLEQLKLQLASAAQGDSSAAVAAVAAFSAVTEDESGELSEMSAHMASLQQEVDSLEAQLRQEKSDHKDTQEELDNLKQELEKLKDQWGQEKTEWEGKLETGKQTAQDELAATDEALQKAKARIEELEKARLKNLPVDAQEEVKELQIKLAAAEAAKAAAVKAKISAEGGTADYKLQVDTLNKAVQQEKKTNKELQDALLKHRKEKEKEVKEVVKAAEKKEKQRAEEEKKKISALEKKIAQLSAAAAAAAARPAAAERPTTAKGTDAKTEAKLKQVQEQYQAQKKEAQEAKERVRALERELKELKSAAASAAAGEKSGAKKTEKQLKDLEKKLESEKKKVERETKKADGLEQELKEVTKERDGLQADLKKKEAELDNLGVAAKQGLEAMEKAEGLEKEVKKLTAENKTLTENYNSERVLRKKYYNMVEDMKGKIRVYCRSRPLSGSELERGNVKIIRSPDEYTIQVDSNRGTKEFQFDSIFGEEHSQEKIFEDTNNLIQSAVDGYNVCIFAYGQTGSGKTFTMIGDKDQRFPGIAPRAFDRIFELIEENKSKFSCEVFVYMLELYVDKLIDLFNHHGEGKLDIKKDKKGMVVIQGSVIKKATTSKELFALFDEGSKNRHTSSTKMNADSSRSHLIIGIIIESTNITTGTMTKGKLSLVDLAGSERVAKTGATAEQLKEANSINKSLSALGDVISALSSEQSFIPYRNNKLTMLMQDSLGGNAKTLMFVNISPADYNAEETVISLTYASRVKLITNDAQKNADNKEITRLKGIIAKLKAGENVDEED